ncbi:MAG: SDR family oxidoreductase [Rhizobacter sp.]
MPSPSPGRRRKCRTHRRQPKVEEVAWACAFLCSPRSAAITGSAIHVDGGSFMLG